MSIPGERQVEMRARLGAIADPQERLTVAMGWRSGVRPLAAEERRDDLLVRGCVSRVWLACEMEEGLCRYRVDAESAMVRGLVSLLCAIYDGAAPAEVIAEEPAVMEELGILRNLTPTRRNGLAAVRAALVAFARRVQMGDAVDQ